MLAKAFRSLFARPAAAAQSASQPEIPYPGHDEICAGGAVLRRVERASCDALVSAGDAARVGAGAGDAPEREFNVAGRVPILLAAESEHAAAGVAAGLSMSGLRTGGFASGGGVPFLHESLYAASGKRLPYVFNISCRGLGEMAGDAHDEYHAVADSGVVQMMAASVQEIADLNLIARRLAELSLTPALVGHDAAAGTQAIESLRFPEDALIAAYLGDADDLIDSPTPAQAMVFGAKRRRVPASWDVDRPLVSGVVQNQDAYMQATAAQRPYFFEHLPALADACLDEYAQLTGRRYRRADAYRCADADYLIVAMGSLAADAEAVVDHLRSTRGLRVGVVNVRLFRPFPGDLVGHLLQGKRAVTVLERTTQPLAEDAPLLREVRACLAKCLENGATAGAVHRLLPARNRRRSAGGRACRHRQHERRAQRAAPLPLRARRRGGGRYAGTGRSVGAADERRPQHLDRRGRRFERGGGGTGQLPRPGARRQAQGPAAGAGRRGRADTPASSPSPAKRSASIRGRCRSMSASSKRRMARRRAQCWRACVVAGRCCSAVRCRRPPRSGTAFR